MSQKIFKDLKIIELANVLAGPAVGMFFSELGASVLKIENKLTNGDVTRTWLLPSEKNNKKNSAYFSSVNYNKKSLFLDLTSSKDKALVYKEIKQADIVIVNYKPGDDSKLGMDYDTIKKINPHIIYAHITGFGKTTKRTAYDLVLQAETGFMYMNGTPQSGSVKMPVALIDVIAAHQCKEAVLIALLNKFKTKKGAYIHVSLHDAAIASLANQASNWLMAKHNPQPMGSLHPNIAPYGEIFTTADKKQITLAIGNNKQFKQLCNVLNCTEIAENKSYSENTSRIKNRKKLFALLQKEIKKHPSKSLLQSLIAKDVPVAVINSIKDVFEKKENQKLVLTDRQNNSKRVKTVAFDIEFEK
jgi:crotonobetainyl-CoA:carnitine CoA-transferase CaiB-like acyl-CoA transferase